jgi:hypothetical protein
MLGAVLFALASLCHAEDKRVEIQFNAEGCPTGVNPHTVNLSKDDNDKVEWFAIGADGQPYSGGFTVIFDPFNGGRRYDTNRDSMKSPPVDNSLPADLEVQYKYSIKGHQCDKVFDPNIRII